MMLALVLATISAQGALILEPGDAVIFHLDKGHPVIDHLARDGENPPAGALRARVIVDEAGTAPGTLLTITNNTTGFLNYKAWLTRSSTTRATNVCTLMSRGRSAFENWPYRVDAIAIDYFVDAPERVNCE